MIEAIYKKTTKLLDSNQIPILLFFTSLFILISFASTRLFFSDEGVILDQFYNLIQGSLTIKIAKINTAKGVFIYVLNHLYGKFSYSLLIASLPVYYILKLIDSLYGAHLFILQLWAFSGGIIVYLIAKIRKLKYAELGGVFFYFILIAINLNFFKPIYFPRWGELLSIEFTNILIASFLILSVYLLFRNFFGNKIAIFASFFVIFATPISFYAITLKHHSLTLFLTILSFYFFYKYQEKKDDMFVYAAYISAGLCIWTRILDGAVLLASLLIADLFFFRHRFKSIISILIVILISLVPFLSFNYLILGNPFSIIETVPLTDKTIKIQSAKDLITLDETSVNTKQIELLNKLGYIWNARLPEGWWNVLVNIIFLKSGNTFGVFLVSPFLIIALAFLIERAKKNIKLNTMDKFCGLYALLLFGVYYILYSLFNMNSLISIITDTPSALEYRYLLIVYVILLYFALRIKKIRELIENKFKTIALVYGIILIINLIYFIAEFPIPFLNIYYYAALITSISLIILVSSGLLVQNKKHILTLSNNLMLFIIALALAEASILQLFYYWAVSMTYISPSQNYTILPVLDNILKWMYQTVI